MIKTSFAFDPELYGLEPDGSKITMVADPYPVRLWPGDTVELHGGWVVVSAVELSSQRLLFGRTRINQRVYVVKPEDWDKMKRKEQS